MGFSLMALTAGIYRKSYAAV
eukprot:COSAG01_NODE_80372_length_120_cov_403.714286_1_plen_20_part_01